MKLRSERLTLYRIAGEWAKAVANEPGSLSRDKIFQEFVRGIFRGDFEDDPLAIATYPKGGARRVNGRFVNEAHEPTSDVRWIPFDRKSILKMAQFCAGTGTVFKTWPWDRLANDLRLEDFEPLFRRAYLEKLSITREAFGKWCDQRGHQRPAFWFGNNSAKPAGTVPASLQDDRERKCLEWLQELVEENPTPKARHSKNVLLPKAKDRFGVSGRGFGRCWSHLPEAWRTPGVRPT